MVSTPVPVLSRYTNPKPSVVELSDLRIITDRRKGVVFSEAAGSSTGVVVAVTGEGATVEVVLDMVVVSVVVG